MKQGLEAAPLEELVARAGERYRALRPEGVTPKQPDLFVEAPPGPPPLPEKPPAAVEPVLPALYEPPEEPFAAATSDDLGWERSSGEVPAAVVAPVGSAPAEPEWDVSMPATTGAAEFDLSEAPEESVPEASEPTEPKEPRDAAAWRSLWVLAIAAIVVVGAGLVWVVARLLAPLPAGGRNASATKVELPAPPALPPASTPVAAAVPTPVTTPAGVSVPPKPAPTKPAPEKPRVAPRPAAKTRAASTPAPGRVASFVTRDWAGRSPVFIVHFASHQDRAAAAADAAKLASEFERPARAVEVDLGGKGIWYRVVVGEFRTAEEAKAFRSALAAKKTPGMGFVYEMRGAR